MVLRCRRGGCCSGCGGVQRRLPAREDDGRGRAAALAVVRAGGAQGGGGRGRVGLRAWQVGGGGGDWGRLWRGLLLLGLRGAPLGGGGGPVGAVAASVPFI